MNERRDAIFAERPNTSANLPRNVTRRERHGVLFRERRTLRTIVSHGRPARVARFFCPARRRSFKFPWFFISLSSAAFSYFTYDVAFNTNTKLPRHPSLQINPSTESPSLRVKSPQSPNSPRISRIRIVSNSFAMSKLWVSRPRRSLPVRPRFQPTGQLQSSPGHERATIDSGENCFERIPQIFRRRKTR